MIFYGPKVGNPSLLLDWANARGHQCHAVHSVILGNILIEASAKTGSAGDDDLFVVDYPIQSKVDLSTIETFFDHVLSMDGFWYYAPRPNVYLDVADAALIGIARFNRKVVLPRPSSADRLLKLARAVHRRLPNSVKPLTRKLGIAVTGAIAKQTPLSIPAMVETQIRNGPASKRPYSLDHMTGSWQEWIPSLEVMRRDLIERGEHFFPFPRGIHVITLNKCNLACVMCPYHSPIYKPHHKAQYFDEYRAMSLDTFRAIADYAGARKIALQFGQIEEPLMHKKFLQFLRYAFQAGVPNIHLTTNGTLLDPARADELIATGIHSVMFSVDALTPETYTTIRGGDLDQLEENIRYFVPRARKKGIRTWVSFVLQEQSRAERDQFLQRWVDFGVDHVTFYVLTERDLKTGAYIRAEEFYDKGQRYPCASPWVQSVVFPDGEVSLCCKTMTDVGWRGVVSVGRIGVQSFEEIWRSERYRKVRRELLDNAFQDFDVCSDCTIWSASTSMREDTPEYLRVYNETMETYTFKKTIP